MLGYPSVTYADARRLDEGFSPWPTSRSNSTRTSCRSRSGSTTSPPTSIRPAAPEWDEREETPWPIIEEAAKIGLYSMEFIANVFGDPTGLTFPIDLRGAVLG